MNDGPIWLLIGIILGVVVMVAAYHVFGLLAMSGKHDRGDE